LREAEAAKLSADDAQLRKREQKLPTDYILKHSNKSFFLLIQQISGSLEMHITCLSPKSTLTVLPI